MPTGAGGKAVDDEEYRPVADAIRAAAVLVLLGLAVVEGEALDGVREKRFEDDGPDIEAEAECVLG